MPTALELKQAGWKPYIEAAQARLKMLNSSVIDQDERAQILARVHDVATILKTRFGAKRVILFGSLVDTAWFTPDSDVDLAVEGLTSEAYWSAWRVAEDIVRDRTVDLIEIETARSSLLQAIKQYGIEL